MKRKTKEKFNVFIKIGAVVLAVVIAGAFILETIVRLGG